MNLSLQRFGSKLIKILSKCSSLQTIKQIWGKKSKLCITQLQWVQLNVIDYFRTEQNCKN